VSPEELVREVFARVRASNIEVAQLYAPDATLTASDTTHKGRAAIAEFYASRFHEGGVHPQVQEIYLNPPLVVAVLRVTAASGVVHHVADVFELEGGLIRSMRACMRA
jgi:SnoaL-like domain